MPESFQGLRYPESRDSILTREAFEALLEACMKSEPGELEPFLRRRSMNELKEDILPGFLSLSNSDLLLLSSTKLGRVGDSVENAGWSSLDSKKGMLSSKESDFGRGMAPLTVFESNPREMSGRRRKSIASFKPPALFLV
jgi:hypothetical protein